MEKRKIGELLVEGGWVTSKELTKALEIQKSKNDRIGRILIELGYLTEEAFLEFLSSMPSIPTIDLAGCEIDPEIIGIVPEELACRLELVPIGKIGRVLTVGMVCPLDEKGKEELEHVTGLKIRAVLCSRNAVLDGLEKYYTKSHKMSVDATSEEELPNSSPAAKLGVVAKLTEQISDLPTLPDIVGRISAVISDPNSSAKDMANVIATDSALAGRILKLANSPAYGFSRQVTSIGDAIALIGFRETQELAISVSVFDKLVFRSDFDFRSYWKHSLECATLTRLISRSLKPGGLESAFISGLLHDMGKVILARKPLAGESRISLPYSASDETGLKLEEVAFGINHAEAGYLLAEHWLLPGIVANAIRYHHTPDEESVARVPTRIVWLANTFCRLKPQQFSEDYEFEQRVLKTLNILEMSEAGLRAALKSYSESVSELPSF